MKLEQPLPLPPECRKRAGSPFADTGDFVIAPSDLFVTQGPAHCELGFELASAEKGDDRSLLRASGACTPAWGTAALQPATLGPLHPSCRPRRAHLTRLRAARRCSGPSAPEPRVGARSSVVIRLGPGASESDIEPLVRRRLLAPSGAALAQVAKAVSRTRRADAPLICAVLVGIGAIRACRPLGHVARHVPKPEQRWREATDRARYPARCASSRAGRTAFGRPTAICAHPCRGQANSILPRSAAACPTTGNRPLPGSSRRS